jgi:hypothetical protein
MAKAKRVVRNVPPAAQVRAGVREYLADCLAFGLPPASGMALKVVWHGGSGDAKDQVNEDGKNLVERVYEEEHPAYLAARAELGALDKRRDKRGPAPGKNPGRKRPDGQRQPAGLWEADVHQ